MSRIGLSLGTLLCMMAAGCGASEAKGGGGSKINGASGFDGSSGFGSTNTAGISGSQGTAGTGMIVQVLQDGGAVCGATSQAASQVVTQKTVQVEVEVTEAEPVALYLMVDNSGSMASYVQSAGGTPGGSSRWDLVVQGITAMVNDMKSTNIDVALQYFPGGGGEDCDGSSYATPAVALGRLPAHAPNIVNSLNMTMTYGSNNNSTPTEGAIRGLNKYCEDFQAAHADNDKEKCIAVLITDGDPNGCSEDKNALAGLVEDAKAAGVTTYVIGIPGSNDAFMDQLAVAGGSDCAPTTARSACNAASQLEFITSLETIRDHVTTTVTKTEVHDEVQNIPLPCSWKVPPPSTAEPVDPDKINVQFTALPGSAAASFGRVDAMAACGTHADAWYYDNNDNPTQIEACPGTCDAVKAATMGKIDVLLGCETVVIE